MFKPKFQILLTSNDFFSDEFACLGSQLITIIKILQPLLKPHFWLGANASGYGKVLRESAINSFVLRSIGGDAALIDICSEVAQFLSGVFFAVDRSYLQQAFSLLEVDTEDEQFRCLDLQGVLIEIRAFDTAYFECYSEDASILQGIAQGLNREISIRHIATPPKMK